MGMDSMVNQVPDYSLQYDNIIFTKVNFTDFVFMKSMNYTSLQVDFKQLIANTPASKLWGTGAVTKIGHYLTNISDLLRIVLLLNFGGVYLDSDVISVRPIPRKV